MQRKQQMSPQQWHGNSVGKIQLRNDLHPAVDCIIKPYIDPSIKQVAVEEVQGAKSVR